MRRFVLPFLLMAALMLPACETTPKGAQQSVYTAKSTYSAVLDVANEYRNLPVCPVGAPVCRTIKMTETVLKADDVAAATLNTSEAAVRDPRATGDTLDKAVLAAESAVTAFKSILNTLRTK